MVFWGRRVLVEVQADAATYRLGEDDEPLDIMHWARMLPFAPAGPNVWIFHRTRSWIRRASLRDESQNGPNAGFGWLRDDSAS